MKVLLSRLFNPLNNSLESVNQPLFAVVIVSSLNSILLLLSMFTTYPDNLIFTIYDNLSILLPLIVIIGAVCGIIDTIIISLLIYVTTKIFRNKITLRNAISITVPYKAAYSTILLIINIILIAIRTHSYMSYSTSENYFLSLLVLMPITYITFISLSFNNKFTQQLRKISFIVAISFILSLIIFLGQIFVYEKISVHFGRMRIQSFFQIADIPTEKLFKGKMTCIKGNCTNGKGTALYNYGFSYIGAFQNGIPNGYGELYRYQIINNRLKSKGTWKNGKLIKKE